MVGKYILPAYVDRAGSLLAHSIARRCEKAELRFDNEASKFWATACRNSVSSIGEFTRNGVVSNTRNALSAVSAHELIVSERKTDAPVSQLSLQIVARRIGIRILQHRCIERPCDFQRAHRDLPAQSPPSPVRRCLRVVSQLMSNGKRVRRSWRHCNFPPLIEQLTESQ